MINLDIFNPMIISARQRAEIHQQKQLMIKLNFALIKIKLKKSIKYYIQFLRAMRIDALDKVAIEIKIAELDKILEKVRK